MEKGGPLPARPSTQAVFVALLLALVGVAMAIYLVATHGGNLRPPKAEEVSMVSMKQDDSFRLQSFLQSLNSLFDGVPAWDLRNPTIRVRSSITAEKSKKSACKCLRPSSSSSATPKAGTPLMLAAPTVAIDLPLKLLIREDGAGKVWISYNTAEYLQERHGLPDNLLPVTAIVEKLATAIAE